MQEEERRIIEDERKSWSKFFKVIPMVRDRWPCRIRAGVNGGGTASVVSRWSEGHRHHNFTMKYKKKRGKQLINEKTHGMCVHARV